MKKHLALGAAIAAAAAFPTTALADTTEANKSNASKQCKTMRAGQTKAQFASTVTALTKSSKVTENNAFGKCVSFFAKQDAKQDSEAKSSANSECKAEQAASDAAGTKAFETKYGTNKNGKNAFGKCVSSKAKEQKDEADAEDQKEAKAVANAAKECKKPGATAAFGTGKNAFGKCVSAKSKAKNDSTES
jgi:hypothetical protein